MTSAEILIASTLPYIFGVSDYVGIICLPRQVLGLFMNLRSCCDLELYHNLPLGSVLAGHGFCPQ